MVCYSMPMKRALPAIITLAIILTGTLYIVVTRVANHYLHAPAEAVSATITCPGKGTGHTVIIAHNTMQPTRVQAKACDTLTITNTDGTTREMAFGKHDHHQAYDGITEKNLKKDESFTVTLDEVGNYTFHDHLHDELVGSLTVVK
jgi:plastocyanin